MPTIKDEWKALQHYIPQELRHNPRAHALLKSIFYAGATSMFANAMALGELPDDEAQAALNAYTQEISDYLSTFGLQPSRRTH